MKRLWEVEHPYHCNKATWNNNNHYCHTSATKFLEEFGGNDADLNYVVRWDWNTAEDGTQTFCVYEIRQRKGFLCSHQFPVTHDDEPKLRAWLEQRYETVVANWKPIRPTKSVFYNMSDEELTKIIEWLDFKIGFGYCSASRGGQSHAIHEECQHIYENDNEDENRMFVATPCQLWALRHA